MSDQPRPLGFATRAVHAGAKPDPVTGARITPIYQTASFVFENAENASAIFGLEKDGYGYSRFGNPTVKVLEERIANLEGGAGATCTASGIAAQMLALSALMQPGDEVLSSERVYGGTTNQFRHSFPRAFGWKTAFFDPAKPDTARRLIQPRTRAIYLEVLVNPGGELMDIEAYGKIAAEAGLPLVVDNTFATPYLLKPIDYGATLITHSTTKHLSGHGNCLGGVVVDSGKFDWSASDRYPALAGPDPAYDGMSFHQRFGPLAFTYYGHAVGLRDFGAVQSPFNAFLTLMGIETLPLRLERQSASALKVAQWLEKQPQVSFVTYAGLPSNPTYALAQKILPRGAGSIFSFGVKGGRAAAGRIAERTKIFSHQVSIGDTRSLILHPASTTHRVVPRDRLAAAGLAENGIRLSIGLEDAEDLIADLTQAMAD